MFYRHILLGAVSAAALCGCAGTVTPTTVSNTAITTAYSAEVALTAAEQAATAYIKLPLCPQPSGALCSSAAISTIIKADAAQADADLVKVKAGAIDVSVVAGDINLLVGVTPATK